jgi:7-dehydrocholesterol reductase
MLVIFSWIALENFGGSVVDALASLYASGPLQFLSQYAPSPTLKGVSIYCLWLTIQAALYTLIPCKLSTGQLTPAGYLLQYHCNGLAALALSHLAFIAFVNFEYIDANIIAKNWPTLLICGNAYGYLLTLLAYIKARVAPTHPEDRKFSGMCLN